MRRTIGRLLPLMMTVLLPVAGGCVPLEPQSDPLGVSIENGIVEGADGVLVAKADEDGLAYRAGIQDVDVITMVDGKSISTMAALRMYIDRTPLDTTINIQLYRPPPPGAPLAKGQDTPVTLTLAADEDGTIPTFLGMKVKQAGGDAGTPESVIVVAVDKDGEAWDIGLIKDDAIHAINKKPIYTLDDFRRGLADVSAGATVTFSCRRDNESDPVELPFVAGPRIDSSLPLLGLTVQRLTPDLANDLDFQNKGARITALMWDSPALNSGLAIGDIIINVATENGISRTVENAAQLRDDLADLAGQNVIVTCRRGRMPPSSVSVLLAEARSWGRVAPDIGMSLRNESVSDGGSQIRVEWVASNGPASRADIEKDDVVTHVGADAVFTIADFWREIGVRYDGSREVGVRLATRVANTPKFVILRLAPTNTEHADAGTNDLIMRILGRHPNAVQALAEKMRQ